MDLFLGGFKIINNMLEKIIQNLDEINSAFIGLCGVLTGIIIGIIMRYIEIINSKNQFKEGLEIQQQNIEKTLKIQIENVEKTIKNEILQNNKKLSLQYITEKRVDWIYAVREVTAEFISLSHHIANEYKIKNKNDAILVQGIHPKDRIGNLKLPIAKCFDLIVQILGNRRNLTMRDGLRIRH
jgi:hypothetical protein